jgi:hypothetical protein
MNGTLNGPQDLFTVSMGTQIAIDKMQLERFRTFVKHHSTVEKYMANKNLNWMVFRDS